MTILDPEFLRVEDVMELHAEGIAPYGATCPRANGESVRRLIGRRGPSIRGEVEHFGVTSVTGGPGGELSFNADEAVAGGPVVHDGVRGRSGGVLGLRTWGRSRRDRRRDRGRTLLGSGRACRVGRRRATSSVTPRPPPKTRRSHGVTTHRQLRDRGERSGRDGARSRPCTCGGGGLRNRVHHDLRPQGVSTPAPGRRGGGRAGALRNRPRARHCDESVAAIAEGMLQSASFLYHWEIGPIKPTVGPDGLVPLTPWQIASRLASNLGNGQPDDRLLQAAETGGLSTPTGVAAEAARLIADPKHARTLLDFHQQWLLDVGTRTADLAGLLPAGGLTPEAVGGLSTGLASFLTSVYATGDGTLGALLTAPRAFVNPDLAAIYGVPAPTTAFGWVMLDPTERGGCSRRSSSWHLFRSARKTPPSSAGCRCTPSSYASPYHRWGMEG